MVSPHQLVPKPFLRWAGGKKWFSKHLQNLLPSKVVNYHEIFLGSGSVFFNLPNDYYTSARLSDTNRDLINAFQQVKSNCAEVISILKSFQNTEKFYYSLRDKYDEKSKAFNAARLIFLNKTGFNGIYRVNSDGRFNVPYGFRKSVDFVDEQNLIQVRKRLKNVTLKTLDFEHALENIQDGDLVFIDPPYTVAHENNGFIAYNQKLFSIDDQVRLAKATEKIHEKGAYFILTNAAHKSIKSIYENCGLRIEVTRMSLIGGSGAKRELITEYIFTNCNYRQ